MADRSVSMREAAEQLGISTVSLRRRLHAGELAAFQDPLDHRWILLRARDIDRYRQPRPLARKEVAPTA